MPSAELRNFNVDVARVLKRRFGSEIHFYCANSAQLRFYSQFEGEGVFDTISQIDILNPQVGDTRSESAIIASARDYEAKLGTTFNTLALANRHYGHGYALGGFRHPRSRQSELTDYVGMLAAYNYYFDFWSAEIETKGITVMLGGPKEAACAAKMFGIPYRQIGGSRYENYHYWAVNEFYETPEVGVAFLESASKAPDPSLTKPYLVEQVHRKRFEKDQRIGGLLKRLSHHILQRGYWRLRGYEKAKGYYLAEELSFIVRSWRETRRMTGNETVALDDMSDKPFVFFPLHTEPEASLGQFSPEYFFQLSAIAALSRDLPAGVTLAVKETIHGVGRRPRDFYNQILDLKNVVILNMMEYGLDVVHRAVATATITGTAGFEACVIGKPVISFGRHNNYNVLAHVFDVTDETQTATYIAKIFDGGFDSKRAKTDGARFLQAVVETSFDMGRYNYTDYEDYDATVVEDAVDTLLRSLTFYGPLDALQASESA